MHKKAPACWLTLAIAMAGVAQAQPDPTPLPVPGTTERFQEGGVALSELRAYAELGYVSAQYRLAQRYLQGQGVMRDVPQAALWFRRAAAKGFINATDCADYLTKKGMPFRDAYKCTGTMVAACIREGKTLEELTLDEFKQYSDLFEDDVYTAIDLTTCCEGRTSYGGPTKASVMKQVADVKGKLA